MLALEYPRAEAGAKPRAEQLGKEESEDEKGDDLELRFKGRYASKQLIQQSADKGVTSAGIAAQGNSVKAPRSLEFWKVAREPRRFSAASTRIIRLVVNLKQHLKQDVGK
ncbi:unnamed protein product [Calypogeia fissa]